MSAHSLNEIAFGTVVIGFCLCSLFVFHLSDTRCVPLCRCDHRASEAVVFIALAAALFAVSLTLVSLL